MDNPVTYRLSDRGYTLYHRAALGGLAATIRAWGDKPPDEIWADYNTEVVRLGWSDEINDVEAVRRILAASFTLTPDHMIELPGHGITAGAEDLRLAIHNALSMTFLQHNKMRPSPPTKKSPIPFNLKNVDEDEASLVTYKAIERFAHQSAQSTGLFLTSKKAGQNEETLSETASIQQWCVPGALGGAKEIVVRAKDVLLLSFLMVASPVFILRSRRREEKAQYCVVVPDVVDLKGFARALSNLTARRTYVTPFSSSLRGRVVGGAEEAALRFLLDLKIQRDVSHKSVSGCLAITMGKVAWDKNQVNRSSSLSIRGDYAEMAIFEAANQHLGRTRFIKGRGGEAFAVPTSHIPELVAANLASDRHWCSDFKSLVAEKNDFQRMYFSLKGLIKMKQALQDADDLAVIQVFQDAWRRKMKALYKRAERDGLDGDRLVEVERERMRNDILRSKTMNSLGGWFLRFCADATRGATLPTLRDQSAHIRQFIFNQRHFDRFQNLCLFALVSYEGKDADNKKDEE